MVVLNKYQDERGVLVPINFSELPFEPKRLFYVMNVPKDIWRGGHAHYNTIQALICLKGRILIKIETKNIEEEITLNEGQMYVIDKFTWDSQKFLDDNSILLVVCSTEYDREDYIFDKEIILNK
jgi:dTDP-4-dehydrorhamnose 3,5-epimerase-like enzyme